MYQDASKLRTFFKPFSHLPPYSIDRDRWNMLFIAIKSHVRVHFCRTIDLFSCNRKPCFVCTETNIILPTLLTPTVTNIEYYYYCCIECYFVVYCLIAFDFVTCLALIESLLFALRVWWQCRFWHYYDECVCLRSFSECLCFQ